MLENKIKATLLVDPMALRNARGKKHHCKPQKLNRMIVSYEMWEISHHDHQSLLTVLSMCHMSDSMLSLPHRINSHTAL